MTIIVCIKPIKASLISQDYVGDNKMMINPYDLKALEEVVALKQELDFELITLAMGQMSTEEALIRTLALGADRAILLNDKFFAGSDTVATSYILHQAIKKIGNVDLVVCGSKSLDGETGQVVHGIGERLGYNNIFSVDEIKEIKKDSMTILRREKDKKISLLLGFPSLIYFTDFRIYSQNFSLLALKKAKRKGITVWGADDIEADITKCGVKGSKTKVLDIKNDLVAKDSIYISGSSREKADFIKDKILLKKA